MIPHVCAVESKVNEWFLADLGEVRSLPWYHWLSGLLSNLSQLLDDSVAGGGGAGLKLGVCNSLQLCEQLGLQVQPLEEMVLAMTPV